MNLNIKTPKDIPLAIRFDFSAITEERNQDVIMWEKKIKENEKLERYKKTVPMRYWGESLATFKTETDEQKKALNIAKQFVKVSFYHPFKTLVLLGNVGSGKTHLACGILKELGGTYRMSTQIVEEFRKIKSFKSPMTEKDLLREYALENLLVIDEIGRATDTVSEQYMLYQVINEFYNKRKALILISNKNKKDFLDYVGTAGIDRLSESATIFEFTSGSYRKEIRQNLGAKNDN